MKLKTTAAVLMSLTILMTACTTGNNEVTPSTEPSQTNETQGAATKDPFGKYSQPITLSIGKGISAKGTNLPNGDTVENNEYFRYIEKKLNVKVKFAWQTETEEAYQQKLSVSIASRDIPDAFLVNEKQLKQLTEADLIADLTDVYEKLASPLIKGYYDSYEDRVLKRGTINGKLMGLPSTRISGQHSLTWIRQDWLEKVGIETPKTLDDLVAVAKAFVEKDPDGNGQKDTVGLTSIPDLSTYEGKSNFSPILGSLHAYKGQWMKDKSGNVSYSSILPEMKTALAKLRDLYAAGIIDKQFAIRKDVNELGAAGKLGIVLEPWWSPYGSPLTDSVKNDPKAEWKAYSVPVDADGKFNTYDTDPAGSYLVVRKGYEHPDAVMKILNVQTQAGRMLDPDAIDIYKGLNVGWWVWPFALQLDTEDAVFRNHSELNSAWEAKDPSKLNTELTNWYNAVKKNDENPKKDLAAWSEVMARMEGAAQTDPANFVVTRNVFFGQTKTMELKWSILQKLENETFLKIVMGEEPVDKFDSFVAEWKRLGGNQITKEVEEEVKKK